MQDKQLQKYKAKSFEVQGEAKLQGIWLWGNRDILKITPVFGPPFTPNPSFSSIGKESKFY
jgi:hypothetical protein